MEIDRLRELVVFSETMNYSIAAKQLFIAQPTLSQHIRKMEIELGFDIVDRANPGTFTPEGELFLARIQRVIHDYDDIVTSCAEASSKRLRRRVRYFDYSSGTLARLLAQSTIETERTPFSPSLGKYTEFDLLDKNICDIVPTFYPDSSLPERLSEEKKAKYELTPLEPLRCLFILNKSNPLASVDRFSDAPQKTWSITESSFPLLASGINAVFGSLTAAGVSAVRIGVRSLPAIYNVLQAEPDNLSVFFEGALDGPDVPEIPDDIIIREFDDLPISIIPYAIARKDNQNPDVAKTMALLHRST